MNTTPDHQLALGGLVAVSNLISKVVAIW